MIRDSVAMLIGLPTSVTLVTGESQQLSVTLLDARGDTIAPVGRIITWASNDTSRVRVTADGRVFAEAPTSSGPVIISATSEGKSASTCVTVVSRPVSASTLASLNYLSGVPHPYVVYEDVSGPCNHFHAWSKISDSSATDTINGTWTAPSTQARRQIRSEFRPSSPFAGFYFLNGTLGVPAGDSLAPRPNFGVVPNAGIDLSGATELTFWAAGARGGEVIDFFMGGVGRDPATGQPMSNAPYPESTPVVKRTITLTTNWTQYRIPLTGRDLHYVLGGFGWVASLQDNPQGAVFFLDDIQYELDPAAQQARLNQPRLLRSYTTLALQPDPFDANTRDDIDFVLRNTAFTYDNALALLAYLSAGTPDAAHRAQLIGDALVYASRHDRTFTDGRLRSAYAAGDNALWPGWLAHGRSGTAPVPGFFSDNNQKFYEVEQSAIDVGNNAWAMIALLALYRQTQRADSLDVAQRLGDFIATFRDDIDLDQGYQGGLNDPESNPVRRTYASTEHNLDVYAAFSVMFAVTHNPVWQERAEHARRFVDAM